MHVHSHRLLFAKDMSEITAESKHMFIAIRIPKQPPPTQLDLISQEPGQEVYLCCVQMLTHAAGSG